MGSDTNKECCQLCLSYLNCTFYIRLWKAPLSYRWCFLGLQNPTGPRLQHCGPAGNPSWSSFAQLCLPQLCHSKIMNQNKERIFFFMLLSESMIDLLIWTTSFLFHIQITETHVVSSVPIWQTKKIVSHLVSVFKATSL